MSDHNTNTIAFDPTIWQRAVKCLGRFTERRAESECWPWTGAVTANGYGMVRAHSAGINFCMHAHRFALIASGVAVPLGADACHRCDVRRCVNPAHLFVGTRSDNMRDMMQKRRRSYPRGSAHECAKLTDADVREIRRRVMAGEKQRRIAAEYGVDGSWVSRVVRRISRQEVA